MNASNEEWKAADDGPEMNHGKIFKSFSVIYDVIHFNSRREERRETVHSPLEHNPIKLNIISISMQSLLDFY